MSFFSEIKALGHEQVIWCNDPHSGLKAIIAIHDTTLGPALGGCRFWNYASPEEALTDVLRLSRGMTYKAAVAGLSLGGGKAVLIGDPKTLKTPALFKSFGRFVHSLGGRYITAEDVHVGVSDMEHVLGETPYVTGVASRKGGSGDPSPVTALGVFHGIRAAVQYKLGQPSLEGITVAVQGCGAVGTHLCKLLFEAGVKLTVADIQETSAQNIKDRYHATIVPIEAIHAWDVQVFAPCALGGILNDQTIPEIKASVIAGGANNQLWEEHAHSATLKAKQILYAPDYVINAGGLINVCHELKGYDQQAAHKEATHIYDTLLHVFKTADQTHTTTLKAANELAETRIQQAKNESLFLKKNFHNQAWIRVS